MPPQRPSAPQPTPAGPLIVDPRWLLKALLAAFAVAAGCAYALICVLFHYQQWQLVLHPSRTVASDPSSVGLPYKEIRFSPDTAGQARLDGWWIPADAPSDPTVLLLHGADGTMADVLPIAKQLHDARMHVFLFDYRGYGRSAGAHPDEKAMQADSETALAWLVTAGQAAPGRLLVAGQGLGASLATQLCAAHADGAGSRIAGLLLVDGDGDTAERASRDTRARLVPFRWLYHEDFPLAEKLSTLATPKLLVSHTSMAAPVDVQRAASPKMSYEIGVSSTDAAMHEALRRFLDTYFTQPPQELLPAR